MPCVRLFAPADPFPLSSRALIRHCIRPSRAGAAVRLHGGVSRACSCSCASDSSPCLLILHRWRAFSGFLPGRPRQWGELWMDLFFTTCSSSSSRCWRSTLAWTVADCRWRCRRLHAIPERRSDLLLVFRIPALVNAAVWGRSHQLPRDRGNLVPRACSTQALPNSSVGMPSKYGPVRVECARRGVEFRAPSPSYDHQSITQEWQRDSQLSGRPGRWVRAGRRRARSPPSPR